MGENKSQFSMNMHAEKQGKIYSGSLTLGEKEYMFTAFYGMSLDSYWHDNETFVSQCADYRQAFWAQADIRIIDGNIPISDVLTEDLRKQITDTAFLMYKHKR